MFTAMVTNQTIISRDYNKKLVKIIQALLAYQQSNIFRKAIPHKALGWDDYKDIVKKSMDLNFVRRQYNEGKYKFVEEVLDQIQLIWDNVFLYGKKQHDSYELAVKMQKYFDDLINDLLPQYHSKIDRVAYFSQFKSTKPEKNSYQPAATLKQIKSKKSSNIESQHGKEELKNQMPIEKSQINPIEKKFIMNLRKVQNSNQKNSNLQTLNQQKIQTQSRNIQFQHKQNEQKKTSKNKNKQSVFQEPVLSNICSRQNALNQLNERSFPSAVKKNEISQNIQISKSLQKSQSKQPKNTQINQNSKPINNIPQPVNLHGQVGMTPALRDQQLPIQTQTIQFQQPFEAEQSPQNLFPPINVNLNKTPSLQQINEISDMMKFFFEAQQFETLSKIVKILTKYQKQHMVIDGEDVNFRMNLIHVSTYNRIRKQLQAKFKQLEQTSKIKDVNLLKQKYNIKFKNQNIQDINQSIQNLKADL